MKTNAEIAAEIIELTGASFEGVDFIESILEKYYPTNAPTVSFQAAPNAPTCPTCYEGTGKPSKARPGECVCTACGLHFKPKE